MRKYVTIFLSLLIASSMFAAGVKKGKKKPLSKTTKLPRIIEPIYNNNTLGPNHRFGPKVNYSIILSVDKNPIYKCLLF